jgi:hypothetical protein
MNSERFDVPRPDEWTFIRPVSDRPWHEIKPECATNANWAKLIAWLQQLPNILKARHVA